jgi:YGGT family
VTIEERQTTVQTNQDVTPVAQEVVPVATRRAPAVSSSQTFSSRSTAVQASGAELARRVVVLVFGLIQAVIVLRIVLLLMDARTGNDLVAGILNISQVFVAPFEGILNSNALKTGGSVLDLAAVLAIIGWTILEFLVFAVINLFRHESTHGGLAA